MAYQPHYRVTALGISGTTASPIEIWSWGFQFGFPGTGGDSTVGPIDVTTLSVISTGIAAIHNNTSLPTGSNHFLTGFKVAEIDAAGHYVNPVQETVLMTPDPGDSAGNMPLQVATVVSLQGENVLPRTRGRFYLPCSSVNLPSASTGKLGATETNGLSLTVVGVFEDINEALENFAPGMRVVIASNKGINARVAEVRVGDVLDTQRRRRNALQEVYSANLVPA